MSLTKFLNYKFELLMLQAEGKPSMSVWQVGWQDRQSIPLEESLYPELHRYSNY